MARNLAVVITGDSSRLERAFKSATGVAKEFGHTILETHKSVEKTDGVFGSAGKSIAKYATAFVGTAGLVQGLKESVEAASNLNEMVSQTGVVFDDSSADVVAWSKTVTASFGLSQRQALKTAAGFGALFKPLGLVGPEAAKQAESLTQLGGDLASFYDTDVQSALDAIRSGIVGESEPLRQYGALLSETRVVQEALTETGKKHATQLTQQEKAVARIALIYRDTAVAQGDFARTSGGLAGQLKIAEANVDNLKAAIGAELIPIVTQAVKSFNTWISNTKNQKRVTDAVREAVGAFTSVLKTLKSALDAANRITGSTTHTMEAFLAVLVVAKVARFVTVLLLLRRAFILLRGPQAAGAMAPLLTRIATALRRVSIASLRSAFTLGLLRKAFFSLVNPATVITAAGLAFLYMEKSAIAAAEAADKAAAATFKAGENVETSLVPNLARQINALKAAGVQTPQILATLRKRLGGSLKADDLIAEAFSFSSGSDPKLTARIQAQVRARAGQVQTVAAAELAKVAKKRGGFTELSNKIFDSRLARTLDRTTDQSLQGQIASLDRVAGLIRKRIAASVTVQRQLELEDQLVDVIRKRNDVVDQQTQSYVDALEFNVEKAGATKVLTDDIAALRRLQAFLVERIRLQGSTLDREEELFRVGQRIIDAQQQQRDQERETVKLARERQQKAREAAKLARQRATAQLTAAQFRQLGLGPTGADLIPSGKELLKRLGKIKDQVQGTALDTKATSKLLARIRETLVGGLGKLIPEVRQKIDELLDALDVDEAAKKRKKLRFLDPGFGHGVNPVFGVGGNFAGGGTALTINGGLNLYGIQDVRQLENELISRSNARPQPRRGP